jgi:hypothetical protein
MARRMTRGDDMTDQIEKAKSIAAECALELWGQCNPRDRVNLTRRARSMSESEFVDHHDHLPLDGDFDYLADHLGLAHKEVYAWDEEHDGVFRRAYLNRLYQQAIDADVTDDARAAGMSV